MDKKKSDEDLDLEDLSPFGEDEEYLRNPDVTICDDKEV